MIMPLTEVETLIRRTCLAEKMLGMLRLRIYDILVNLSGVQSSILVMSPEEKMKLDLKAIFFNST